MKEFYICGVQNEKLKPWKVLAAISLGKNHDKKLLRKINGCFSTAFKFHRIKTYLE